MPVHYVDAFMHVALGEAEKALGEGEVPVGCVFVSFDANEALHRQLAPSSAAASPIPDAGLAGIDDFVAARGRNQTNALRHALAHAEFVAAQQLLDDAAAAAAVASAREKVSIDAGTERTSPLPSPSLSSLSSYVLYVTVEPCVMCGAMLLYNKVGHVFFGCRNPRFGGNGTVLALHEAPAPKKFCADGSGRGEERSGHRDNAGADGGHVSSSTPQESSATVEVQKPLHAAASPLNHEQQDKAKAAAGCIQQHNEDPCCWWPGYESEGGHREGEAIALLQRFYERENPNAPGHKRRQKTAS